MEWRECFANAIAWSAKQKQPNGPHAIATVHLDAALDECATLRRERDELRARVERLEDTIWRAHARLDIHGGGGVPGVMTLLTKALAATGPGERANPRPVCVAADGGVYEMDGTEIPVDRDKMRRGMEDAEAGRVRPLRDILALPTRSQCHCRCHASGGAAGRWPTSGRAAGRTTLPHLIDVDPLDDGAPLDLVRKRIVVAGVDIDAIDNELAVAHHAGEDRDGQKVGDGRAEMAAGLPSAGGRGGDQVEFGHGLSRGREMSDKLKPCPFCGRQPQLTDRATSPSSPSPTGWIYFAACHCGGHSAHAHQHGYTPEERAVAWNRRTPPPATAEFLALARQMLASDPVLLEVKTKCTAFLAEWPTPEDES